MEIVAHTIDGSSCRPDDPAIVWRQEEQALLERLENEVLLEKVWHDLAGAECPAPHPRAAGLFALLRELPMGSEAAEAALGGDRNALRALMRPTRVFELRPALLHHLALIHGDAAAVLPPSEISAVDGYLYAVGCWLALGAQSQYLHRLARKVVGTEFKTAELDDAVEEAPLHLLRGLVRTAKTCAGERAAATRLALRVLNRVEEAIEIAGIAEHPSGGRVRHIAQAMREEVFDELLAPHRVALDEAGAQGAPDDRVVQLIADVAALWRWADEDVLVERFIVRRAPPISWELYNSKRYPTLRRLNAHIQPVVDRMAIRVESDPAEFAYASSTAQLLVFRAELDPKFDNQLAWARRAVAICATHRNGRLVYADLLAERALRTLQRAPVFGRGRARAAAREDVVKAMELWPELPRVNEAAAALRREGVKIDEPKSV